MNMLPAMTGGLSCAIRSGFVAGLPVSSTQSEQQRVRNSAANSPLACTPTQPAAACNAPLNTTPLSEDAFGPGPKGEMP